MQAAWAFGCDNREEEVRAFWNGKLNGSIIAASRQKNISFDKNTYFGFKFDSQIGISTEIFC